MKLTSHQEALKRFTDELSQVDDVAQIVLKGHLVMEGLINESIGTFVLHAEFVETANLRFQQKVALCRATSTSDHANPMWELISKVNTLRNALAHSLDHKRRTLAIDNLRSSYEREFKRVPDAVNGIPTNIEKDIPPDTALCLYAIAASVGYLHVHLEEVRRFKAYVLDLDRAINKGALTPTASSN